MKFLKMPPDGNAVLQIVKTSQTVPWPAVFFVLVTLFASCHTTDHFVPVDHLVAEENFSRSAELLEENRRTLYRERDRVLYYLDKGMLTHYAGRYEESSRLLQQGERAIEENFSVSISQEIGTFLLNDRVREYDGEDYEDIYLNVFNALNYYHRGNMEGALVEIRRINIKLRDLSVKYGMLISNMQEMALENNTEIPPNPQAPVHFNDSALARYLGMLFHRGSGNMDSARIDRNLLLVAMADAPAIYRNPVPSSIQDELNIPPGMARLNVIGFTGRSPVKREEVLRIFLGNAWIRIALPVMVSRPSRIASVRVTLDSGESFNLELLEDISAVVNTTFSQRRALVYAKSIVRASVKGITASVLHEAAARSEEERKSTLFTLLGLGTQILAEASEMADLRVARYFPGRAYVGGINLPPGTHSFTITYYSPDMQVVGLRHYKDVRIYENTLNLTEDICLR